MKILKIFEEKLRYKIHTFYTKLKIEIIIDSRHKTNSAGFTEDRDKLF
jgi:hypothetical protein